MIHAPETKKTAVFTFIAAVGPTGGLISTTLSTVHTVFFVFVSYVSQNA